MKKLLSILFLIPVICLAQRPIDRPLSNTFLSTVSVGNSTHPAKFNILSTTEQFRIMYDASNYFKGTVNSSGSVTLALTGTTPKFTFSNPVILPAGTATAGTAPLKLASGTNLSTTEAGAIEFDGTHLYFTAANAGTRYQLDQQGGFSNPMTTTGDIIYSSSGSTAARRGIGSTNQVLQVVSGVPNWGAIVDNGTYTP